MKRTLERAPRRVAALILSALVMTSVAGCSPNGTSSVSATTAPAQAVTDSFNDYAAAVNAKNGDRSADLMTASSRAYYDHLRSLALDASRATLQKQPMIDQITVLSLRQTMPVSVLRTADPRDLVSKAVELGLISQNNSATTSLQKITISGTTASADLVQQGEEGTTPVSYPVRFQLEDQHWHFDITSLLGPAQDQMAEAAKDNQLTDQELVERVAEARTSTVAQARALWKPLGR